MDWQELKLYQEIEAKAQAEILRGYPRLKRIEAAAKQAVEAYFVDGCIVYPTPAMRALSKALEDE